ncbi:MAG: TRAP transporter substrate-binding protein, partial [Gammaproteobacteria bacterium]|nr:TRAP transporter substrate-binding protein [Gammaproteobacteria bacterium]
VRKILEETARETQGFVYKSAEEFDNDLVGKMKAAGMKVNEVDKAAFVKASKGVYDEFGAQVPGGKELIDQSLALGK